jgi:tetratricopeptide (TPR) repeat protein
MRCCRWPIALALLLSAVAEVRAQIIFPIAGNFGTYTYKRGRLTVNGYFAEPYPIVAGSVGPFGPVFVGPVNPYAVGPLGGYFPGVPFGSSNSRITVQYIAPTYVIRDSRPGAEYDIAGVDLDAVLASQANKAPRAMAAAPAPEAPEPARDAKIAAEANVGRLKQPEPPEAAPEKPRNDVPPSPPAARKKQPTDDVTLGLTAFQAGEYGLAARHFQRAVAAQPRTGRTYFLLAQAEFALGKYRAAAAAIEAGLMRMPEWPAQVFRPRQDLYRDNDANFMAQVKRLEDAVTHQPNESTFLFLLAYQLWFDGRRQDASVLFQRVRPLTSDPIVVDAFLRVAPGALAAN